MNTVRFWRAARNAALKVVAFWVLLLAAYLALGRQFFPYIDRIKPEVEIWLSGQLGTPVEIGELRGEWVKFNPVMHLSDVTLGDDISVEKMTLAPGIYESISRGGLSFIRFELIDFQADLIETDNGWALQGLQGGGGSMDLSELLNLLRRQQEVQFSETRLNIRPKTLPDFELTLHDGRLVGYGTENSLVARATITANDVEVPIELQVETSQQAGRTSRIYFQHGDIDVSPWLREVQQEITTAVASGEYWLNVEGEQWQDLTVRLDASELIYQGRYNQLRLTEGQTESYFEYHPNGVESWINVLGYQLGERAFGSTQARVSYRAERFKAQWDSLPAELVGQYLSLDDPGGFWNGLSPRGFIEQGVVTLLPQEADSLRLTAQVSELSMSPHQGIPGLNNLDGELKIQGSQGRMQVASSQSVIELPDLYDDPFISRIDQTQLNWRAAPGRGLFVSGDADIALITPANDAQTVVEWPLPLSLNWTSVSLSPALKAAGREGLLEFQLSAENVSRNWAAELADNREVSPATVNWIDTRIKQGRFPELNLNFLSSTGADGQRRSQFFLESSFADAEVQFLDSWSALDGLSGHLALDGEALVVRGNEGRYPDFDIADYLLRLGLADGGLDARFQLAGDAGDALEFLQQGPLSEQVGSQLDGWRGRGKTLADLNLDFVLSQPDAVNVHVDTELSDVALTIDPIGMAFDKLSGELTYSTESGLATRNLTLEHEGLPQLVTVASRLDGAQSPINITAKGLTPVRYWGRRFDDAYLLSNSAAIYHDTDIQVRGDHTEINTRSDLAGMPLDFPYPLSKAATMRWPLVLKVDLDNRNWVVLRAELNEQLQAYFEFDQQRRIRRGSLAYGRPLNVRDDAGVFFDIQTDQVDATGWWRAIQKLRKQYSRNTAADAPSAGFETLIRAISIRSDTLEYLGQSWQQVSANLLRNEDAWLVEFDADQGQGQVLIPHDNAPIFADIDWLNLTTDRSDVAFKDEQDPLQAYSPEDVPDMQLQINKLIWNKRDLGNWRAEINHQDDRMEVSELSGQMQGATLNGQLSWAKNQRDHETEFQGEIRVGDIQDVLLTWNYAPVLTSTSGRFLMDTQWQGSPAFFDFKRITGEIDLRLNRGSIQQVDEYEGLKLIGLLNFTRVIQRLALDFSDLLQSGITFDTVEGELLFDRGFARVGEKLIIDGSATKFKFSGDADLLSDELDIDMVFTVPLSSTFPLVALLAGVSPQAAAAIYVTERVFNNELERLSSARMHITGAFDDPEMLFYRVFDNSMGDDNPSVTDRMIQVVPEGVANP